MQNATRDVEAGAAARGERPGSASSRQLQNPMNAPASSPLPVAGGTPHLIDAIDSAIQSLGDGLNDDELTRLLRQAGLPAEAGFTFLSFSDRNIAFAVPPQALAAWYPPDGWIAPEKEKLGAALAEKYGLALGEPPDRTSEFRLPVTAGCAHHHLEFTKRHETVIVAHPRYLKVRLFGSTFDRRWLRDVRIRIRLGADLLQDLSALYAA
jgi:hypothetical protein